MTQLNIESGSCRDCGLTFSTEEEIKEHIEVTEHNVGVYAYGVKTVEKEFNPLEVKENV